MRERAGRRPSERARTSPTIAVAIAPGGDTEVRNYGIINGTLEALDKLLKKLEQPGVELRRVYEATARLTSSEARKGCASGHERIHCNRDAQAGLLQRMLFTPSPIPSAAAQPTVSPARPTNAQNKNENRPSPGSFNLP